MTPKTIKVEGMKDFRVTKHVLEQFQDRAPFIPKNVSLSSAVEGTIIGMFDRGQNKFKLTSSDTIKIIDNVHTFVAKMEGNRWVLMTYYQTKKEKVIGKSKYIKKRDQKLGKNMSKSGFKQRH